MTATSRAILTSLDSDLWDFQIDGYEAMRESVALLNASGVPLAAFTDKSFDEVAAQIRELGLHRAVIFEGGACLALFETGQWHFERYGPDADAMLDLIGHLELAAETDLSVYSVMTVREASGIIGLSGEALAHSQSRRSDEPFVVPRGKAGVVAAAARKLGYSLRFDGVFHHLYDPGHLKRAVERVRQELHCQALSGIGSTATDTRFLQLCDNAIIVPQKTGADPELLKTLPDASLAPSWGRSGWLSATQEISNLCLSEASGGAGMAGAHLPKRRARNLPSRTLPLSPENSRNAD